MGTKIKQTFPKIFTRIYNLEISEFEIVKNDINRVVDSHGRVLVGLTLIAGNVLRSLRLADLTADHFTSLPVVDAVCTGFGEHIITGIIRRWY